MKQNDVHATAPTYHWGHQIDRHSLQSQNLTKVLHKGYARENHSAASMAAPETMLAANGVESALIASHWRMKAHLARLRLEIAEQSVVLEGWSISHDSDGTGSGYGGSVDSGRELGL